MKDFFRQNGILLLIVAVLLALVTAVVSATLGGVADPLSSLAGWITTPVRNGISAFVNWSQERYDNAFAQEQLKEEYERLKQRVAELEQKERAYEAALQENERLRNLNDLRPSGRTFEIESAMVTARSTDNWESTLTISKGSNMDIAVDDCVVDEYWNLVGVVAVVGPNYSIVRTLVDAEIEMGGLLSRTDHSGGRLCPHGSGKAQAELSAGEQRPDRRGPGAHLGQGRRVPLGAGCGACGGGLYRGLWHDALRGDPAGDRPGRA